MTEADLLAMLKRRIEPECLVLPQVGLGGRIADAVAVGLWRSRGYGLHQYEMKCQRRDWLLEMRNPAKADEAARYMQTFTLVISDDKIALDEEVPAPWGIMVARGTRLVTRRKAQRIADAKPLDYGLMVALLRRATYERDAATQQRAEHDAESRGYKRGYAAGEKAGRLSAARDADRYTELVESLEAFERATGLDLNHRWRSPETARIARWLVAREGGHGVLWGLQSMRRGAEQVMEALDALPDDLLPPQRDD